MIPTTVSNENIEWKPTVGWSMPAAIIGLAASAGLGTPWVKAAFFSKGWQGEYILLVALIVTFALTPLMIHAGHRWNFLDEPDPRKIHAQPTPYIGGVAVYGGCMTALWLGSDMTGHGLAPILFSGSLMFIMGVLDDKGNLPAWTRLAAQVAGAGLVVSTGTVLTLFPTGTLGSLANVLMTFLWIVGIMNAFNFFDGMDGLATGLSILMAVFLGLVAFEADQIMLGWVAMAIVGAGLGFLPYNLRRKKPALIFLGDGGSTFLGFMLACLAVKGDWADGNPIVSFSNPLLIFGVLIYDMIHITVERILTGKVRSVREWIEYVGKDHLHHRLERILKSRPAVVGMIFAMTICLSLSALALRNAGTVDAILLLTQATLIVMMVTILEHAGRHRERE